jgi:hypothetical protein
MDTSNLLLSSVTSNLNDLTQTQYASHFPQDLHYLHEHRSLDHLIHQPRPSCQDINMAGIYIHSLNWIDSSCSVFIYSQDSFGPNLLVDSFLASERSINYEMLQHPE